MLRYRAQDPSKYWQSRALNSSGQTRVLWTNEEYNSLFRRREGELVRPYVESLQTNARVLEVGCGIGIVANLLTEMHPTLAVDAIDLPAMIEFAQRERPNPRIRYIVSPADEYSNPNFKYDMILSSAGFSMIRRIEALEAAISNATSMIVPTGIVLMIDPFHRWNYLARAKYGFKGRYSADEETRPPLSLQGGALFFGPIVCNWHRRGRTERRWNGCSTGANGCCSCWESSFGPTIKYSHSGGLNHRRR